MIVLLSGGSGPGRLSGSLAAIVREAVERHAGAGQQADGDPLNVTLVVPDGFPGRVVRRAAVRHVYLSLCRRQAEVCRHLLTGVCEKEIASRMELSRHTVHCYVKSLFRRFGVDSRAGFMALWVRWPETGLPGGPANSMYGTSRPPSQGDRHAPKCRRSHAGGS